MPGTVLGNHDRKLSGMNSSFPRGYGLTDKTNPVISTRYSWKLLWGEEKVRKASQLNINGGVRAGSG